MFAQMGDDSSVWVPIMEKSISKNFGNYHHIENNFPIEAIRLLTGAPSVTLKHVDYSYQQLLQFYINSDSKDEIIQVGLPSGTSNPFGLVKGHVYTVLEYIELD